MTRLTDFAPLPRPPRLPTWRSMLAGRRAERATKPLWDKLSDREAAAIEQRIVKRACAALVSACETLAPPRRRAR